MTGEEAVGADTGCAPLPDGGHVAYQLSGTSHGGTPILLVRPLGGTAELWGAFRAALAAVHPVISYDHRGSGRSSAPPAVVTTAALARDAVGLLDHLDVARAHVVGVSLGGMAATWLQRLAPERIATLCLASTAARGLELTNASMRRKLALAGAFARPPGDVEVRLVDRTLSPQYRRRHPDEAARIRRQVRQAPSSPVTLLRLALAGVLHDARAGLEAIDVPVLVLAGQDDGLLGVGPPRQLAAAIPGATFDVVPEAGHALTIEQPTATAARVLRFVGGG